MDSKKRFLKQKVKTLIILWIDELQPQKTPVL
jgi:hypothetical protein